MPPKLSSRVRELATGHGRKTDQVDACSVAIAALTGPIVSTATTSRPRSLRLRSEHRDDLVQRRTQIVNRLHVLLTHLIDSGAGPWLTADQAAALLRRVRKPEGVRATQRALAVELVAEVRSLDHRIAAADQAPVTKTHKPSTGALSQSPVTSADSICLRTRQARRSPHGRQRRLADQVRAAL